ncbi:type II secretion system F family protein [Lignipirellula cremea]|nr:type II secretion system F family protein [Lignipirellula cremea]
MPEFFYLALTAEGQRTSGKVQAEDLPAAQRLLAERGWTIDEIQPLPQGASRYTTAETEELASRLTDVAQAGLPLAAGLRAAAEETDSSALRRTFRILAERLEEGVDLPTALRLPEVKAPPFLQILLNQTTSRQPVAVASELIRHYQLVGELRRSLLVAMVYPCFTLLLAILVFAAAQWFVVRRFRDFYAEMELELPASAQLLFFSAEVGPPMVLVLLLIGLVTAVTLRFGLGRARWGMLLEYVPIVGVLRKWASLAEISRQTGALARLQTPLPGALLAVGSSCCDISFRGFCQRLAERVAAGSSLSQAFRSERRAPIAMQPFLRWGEAEDRLPEALEAAGEMLEQRLQVRAELVQRLGPVMVYFTTALLVVGLLLSVLITLSVLASIMLWLS